MKDAYEILRLKEIELSRVKAEVEALGIVAPLLSDEGDVGADNAAFDPLDCAAAAHPGSQGSQYRSTTGTRAGVEDENRGFPIAVGTYRPQIYVNLFIASYSVLARSG